MNNYKNTTTNEKDTSNIMKENVDCFVVTKLLYELCHDDNSDKIG